MTALNLTLSVVLAFHADISDAERIQVALTEMVSRDRLCGSVLDRNHEREICSEASWLEPCEELRSTQTPREDEDSSMGDVDLRTAEFVGHVAYDLLCRTEDLDQQTEREKPEAATPNGKWDYLEIIGRHGDILESAVEGFAVELRSAAHQMSFGLADLNYGARVFRAARDSGREQVRFTDSEGEDLTESVARELTERGERSIREVWEFRSTFAHHGLAEFEVAVADARLWNGLSMTAWGLSNAIDTDEVVDVPLWLTGEDVLVPGSEVAVPAAPPVFRLGTAQSPLEDPSVISESARLLKEFLNEDPEDADCAGLTRAMNDLERKAYSEIERSDKAENSAGFRSARSEFIRFNVLRTLSRGNQTLIDACGQDRNALQWHRRLLQRTADLTSDLHPDLGEILRGVLQNTFTERIESPAKSTGSAGSR